MQKIALTIGLILAYSPMAGFAQEMDLRKPDDMKADFEKSAEKLKAYSKSIMESHLSDLESIAGVEAKTIKKLKLAAKGHVSSIVRERLTGWKEGYEAARKADYSDDDSWSKAMRKYYGYEGYQGPPHQSPKWLALLKKNLNEDQLKKLDSVREARLDRYRDAILTRLTLKLDDILFFSDAERENVFKLLKTEFNRDKLPGDSMLFMATFGFSEQGMTFGSAEEEGDEQLTKTIEERAQRLDEAMKKILNDEKRFAAWENRCKDVMYSIKSESSTMLRD